MSKPSPAERARARANVAARAAGEKPRRGRPPGPSMKRLAEAAARLDVSGGTCPKCKAPCTDEQKACTTCGARLDANACKCGARMKPADKFCGTCGEAREAAEAAGPDKTLAELAEEDAAEGPAAAGTAAPGAQLAPAPPPPPPVRAFNPAAFKVVVYDQISKALKKRGEPELTDEEKRLLADDLADVLNYYIALNPKHAVLARCLTDHIGLLTPKIYLAIVREQRARKEEGK